MLSVLNFPVVYSAEPEDSWKSLAPMPTARGGLGVAVANGKIYAIGGVNGGLPLNTNEEFNPNTNRWTSKTSMPTARTGFAIAVYKNKIYVIGGSVGIGYSSNNEVYDPATDTWETKSSMPTARSDLSASIVNDKIFLISGKKYSSMNPYYADTAVTEVYDPATDTWTTAASIPTPVQGYGSATVDGKIYVISGLHQIKSTGSTIVNSNQVYDVQTDNWSLAASLPVVNSYGAIGATLGFMAPKRLIYLGGYFQNDFSSKTQLYNPDENTWSYGTEMPTPRAYLGIAVIGDVLYAIGGYDGQNWLDTNEEYKPPRYGKVAPTVQILSPENRTYYEAPLSFAVNRETQWMGYSLDNQANVTVKGETILPILTDGLHSIIMYANDSLGNMGLSDTVYFAIDRSSPKILIIAPQNQSYDVTDIQLTFTVDEAVSKLTYSLDGQENQTIIGNVTLPALPDGSHYLTLYAIDEIGNISWQTVYFNIAPFPMVIFAATAAIVTIALAAGYLFFKRRKSSTYF